MVKCVHAVADTLTHGETWCKRPVVTIPRDQLTENWLKTTCALCQRAAPKLWMGGERNWPKGTVNPPELVPVNDKEGFWDE